MTDTNHDIHTLNGLIAATIDSVEGYRAAADDADSGRFTTTFSESASERQHVVASLRAEVSRLGGNPEDDGTVLAAAHRAFMGLKDAITGKDEKAIINEVERGEDHIKAKYQDALKDSSLGSSTRSVIEQAYTSVKAGHDRVSAIKHSFANS